jgi:hypothetical protein
VPRIVTRKDRELVEVLRKHLVPAYIEYFVAKNYDRGTALRLAVRKFEYELANNELQSATAEELEAQRKAESCFKAWFARMRSKVALHLVAPKGGRP